MMVIDRPNVSFILDLADKTALDIEKFNLSLKILEVYFEFSEPLENADKIEQLIEFGKAYYSKQENQDTEILIQFLIVDAKLKLMQWNTKQVIKNIKLIEPQLKKVDAKIYKAYYFKLIAKLKFLKELYREAIEYYNKSLEILKSLPGGILKYKRLYVYLNGALFIAHSEIYEFETAFQYYFEAIKFGKAHKIYFELIYILNNGAIVFINTNAISYFNEAKQTMLDILEEDNSKYIKECLAHIELLELKYKYMAKNEAIFFKKLEQALDKNYEPLLPASIKYINGTYLLNRIEVAFYKNKKGDVLSYCNQLNSLLYNCESGFYYILFLALTRLSISDELYLNKISEMPVYKNYNINRSIDNLFELLIKFTKPRRVKSRIQVYNLIIDYYKKKPPTNMNFKIFTECITELQKICTDTSKFKMAALTTQQFAEKEIKKKDSLLASQKKLIKFFKEFSYTAAHDLKAPIQTITGFSKIIKDSYNKMPAEKAQEYLEKIISTGETMTGFINELLNFEKHSTFDSQNFVVVDLRKVVNQVQTNLSGEIEQSNCKIDILIEYSSVLARKSPIEMLFQNLISNAIKYRRPNVPPKIEISYDNESKVIAIKDNGVGIPADLHKKIFKPFFRIPNENVISTGIGLATCKKIVDSFGGKIWLESEVGKGSTFYFTLK